MLFDDARGRDGVEARSFGVLGRSDPWLEVDMLLGVASKEVRLRRAAMCLFPRFSVFNGVDVKEEEKPQTASAAEGQSRALPVGQRWNGVFVERVDQRAIGLGITSITGSYNTGTYMTWHNDSCIVHHPFVDCDTATPSTTNEQHIQYIHQTTITPFRSVTQSHNRSKTLNSCAQHTE